MILFFDFDGTIIDDKDAVIHAFIKTLDRFGFSITENDMKPVLGDTMENIFDALIPKSVIKKKLVKEAIEYMEWYVTNEGYKRIKPCEGIDVIKTLKGRWKLYLVTNSCRKVVDFLSQKFSIDIPWDGVITSDNGYENKACAFDDIIKRLKLKKDKAF